MVGEHRPEAAQRLRRDPRAEHRDVAFEIGADEILPPPLAGAIAAGKEAVREASAHPQALDLPLPHLERVERMHFEIAYASGQAFARLAQEIDRRRPEQQKPPCPASLATTRVNQSTEYLEEIGKAVHLVEDDELILMFGQIKLGFGKLRAIGVGFQIKVNRKPRLGDLKRERCLSHLSRPDQGNGRRFLQPFRQFCIDSPTNHPSNYGD